jgi:hypothetical protein
MNIQGDLKATLERSLDLKAALEHMRADPSPSSQAYALNRINRLQRRVSATKTSLGFQEPQRPQQATNAAAALTKKTQSSSPMNRRHQGKLKLLRSLKADNLRIIASRAGRRLQSDVPDLTSPVEKALMSTPKCTRFLTELSTEDPCSPKLPFVSLASGKTEEPLNLPSFEEYAAVTGTGLDLNTPTDFALKAVERTTRHIESFKKKLADMLQLSKQPRPVRRETTVTRKTLGPMDLEAVRHAYEVNAQRMTHVIKLSSPSEFAPSFSTPRSVPIIKHIEAMISKEDFRHFSPNRLGELESFNTVESAEEKLSQIVERIQVDRPKSRWRKLRLIRREEELPPQNSKHMTQPMTEIRKVVENEQRKKRRLNLSQAEVYRKLLDYLRAKRRRPNSAETTVISVVKRVLESGEVLDTTSADQMREGLGYKAKEAADLLELLRQSVVN